MLGSGGLQGIPLAQLPFARGGTRKNQMTNTKANMAEKIRKDKKYNLFRSGVFVLLDLKYTFSPYLVAKLCPVQAKFTRIQNLCSNISGFFSTKRLRNLN